MKKLIFLLASLMAVTPAQALVVTSIQVRTTVNDYLQVTELQAFQEGANVALASAGGIATASSFYPGSVSTPEKANDGITNGNFADNCTHGGCGFHAGTSGPGAYLQIALATPSDITLLAIFGRTDCCSNRDIYSFTLFNGDAVVGTGFLNANNASHYASVALPRELVGSAVPEPESWAMLIGGFALAGGALRRRQSVRLALA